MGERSSDRNERKKREETSRNRGSSPSVKGGGAQKRGGRLEKTFKKKRSMACQSDGKTEPLRLDHGARNKEGEEWRNREKKGQQQCLRKGTVREGEPSTPIRESYSEIGGKSELERKSEKYQDGGGEGEKGDSGKKALT